jgi:non-specific serine/threonine protein kinase/serine/threonine-protein kinase
MTPERWQQVKHALDEAIALGLANRAPFLDRIGADDPELRSEVETLLNHHQQANSEFLKCPPIVRGSATQTSSPSRIGSRVGVYELLEEIGQGGMGSVYRAARADGQYEKQVAVKLVRSGHDTNSVLERFRHERQILASLDHPNIARLLDGGTTEDGTPYLVMELIEGIPIDEYCNRHSLAVNQRLDIFRQVCSAVQYAHQRLVIHRDIKPGNILVTSAGVPKLLDFGIAKILDPGGATEATMLHPLTPEYASPEQIRGESITTATDVYSLGVVLYRLLTGQSPYRINSQSPAELARAITETDPQRPSTAVGRNLSAEEAKELSGREVSVAKLRRQLSGDLDNIALMALRKEPQRRYSSAEQLGDDVRRHLEGLPVMARKGSWSYRAEKFIGRNKVAVSAAVLVTLAILGGVIATVHQARIAQANAMRAERRFNDVKKLAHSLMFDIHDSVASLPGATPTLQLLVEDSMEYLDNLAKDASGDISLQRDLATAYEKLGNAQGNPYESNLGDAAGAIQSFQKSLAIRQSIMSSGQATDEDQAALAGAYRLVGLIHWATLGDSAKAFDNAQKALSVAEAAYKASKTPNMRVVGELGMDYEVRGVLLGGDGSNPGMGNPRAGLEDHKKALALFEQLAAAYPSDYKKQRKVPMLNLRIGDELVKLGERKEAIRSFQKALDLQLGSHQDPNNRVLQRDLNNTYAAIGDVLLMEGRPAEAVANFEKALDYIQKLASADASDTSTLMYLAASYADMGRSTLEAGDIPKAITFLRKAVDEQEQLRTASSTGWDASTLAQYNVWLGEALGKSGNTSEELQLYQSALDAYSRVVEADPKDASTALLVAACHDRIAAVLLRTGDVGKAGEHYRRALEMSSAIAPKLPESIAARYLVAATYSGLGDVASRDAQAEGSEKGRFRYWNQAQSWYEQSLSEWSRIPNPSHIAPNEFKVDVPSEVERRLARCRTELSRIRATVDSL